MKKYKLLTRDEAPEIMIHESVKEDFKKSIGWDENEFNKRTVEIIPYYIYICKNCKCQLLEINIGEKCPNCGEWTYFKDCKKECVLVEEDEE